MKFENIAYRAQGLLKDNLKMKGKSPVVRRV